MIENLADIKKDRAAFNDAVAAQTKEDDANNKERPQHWRHRQLRKRVRKAKKKGVPVKHDGYVLINGKWVKERKQKQDFDECKQRMAKASCYFVEYTRNRRG